MAGAPCPREVMLRVQQGEVWGGEARAMGWKSRAGGGWRGARPGRGAAGRALLPLTPISAARAEQRLEHRLAADARSMPDHPPHPPRLPLQKCICGKSRSATARRSCRQCAPRQRWTVGGRAVGRLAAGARQAASEQQQRCRAGPAHWSGTPAPARPCSALLGPLRTQTRWTSGWAAWAACTRTWRPRWWTPPPAARCRAARWEGRLTGGCGWVRGRRGARGCHGATRACSLGLAWAIRTRCRTRCPALPCPAATHPLALLPAHTGGGALRARLLG